MDKSSKTISTSTPSFVIRYNAEDEEIEQLYDSPVNQGEAHSDNSSPQSTPVTEKRPAAKQHHSPSISKTGKRSGSLEDGSSAGGDAKEPWKIFSDIKGITKRVEEKIEEMKCDRLKNLKKGKKLKKQASSLSDSEEKSEDVTNNSSSPADKSVTFSKDDDTNDESEMGDISGSEEERSLLEGRPSTPTFTDDIVPTGSATRKSDDKRKVRDRIKMKFVKKRFQRQHIELAVDAVNDTETLPGIEQSQRHSELSPYFPRQHQNVVLNKRRTYTVVLMSLFALIISFLLSNKTSPFVLGVFAGVFLCFLVTVWSDKIFRFLSDVDSEYSFLHGQYQYQNVPFLSDKMMKKDDFSPEQKYYRGWMNEYSYDYDPSTYHISQTETVYVRLVGNILRLATPKNKIPKRAHWNEPKHKFVFLKERAYDITNCSVQLVPEGLIRKRMWSKKYPIVITLLPNSHLGTKVSERKRSLSDTEIKNLISSKQRDKKSIDDQEDTASTKDNLSSKSLTSLVSDLSLESLDKQDEDISLIQDDTEMTKGDNHEMTVEDIVDDEEGEEEDEISDFVKVPTSESHLYLFARTDREKDQWFRRFVAAASYKSGVRAGDLNESQQVISEKLKENRDKREKVREDYLQFMEKIGQLKGTYEDAFGVITFNHTAKKEREQFMWINVLMARVLYDAMKEEKWVSLLQNKIQRKLSVIKVPSFMDPIILSSIEFSGSVPVIECSHVPNVNADGVWAELEISYQGVTSMTLDTKINLMKMKKEAAKETSTPESPEKSHKTAYLYSSQEDSAESSGEEKLGRKKPPGKALTMIDKIAASSLFQQMTEHRLVKKAMDSVSKPLSLKVDVKRIIGTIVLNIPPPPSDRIWYGFKPNTKIHLSATPVVGERGINMNYISNFIEKKMYAEFQKVLVMPNMDDLIIPLMSHDDPY